MRGNKNGCTRLQYFWIQLWWVICKGNQWSCCHTRMNKPNELYHTFPHTMNATVNHRRTQSCRSQACAYGALVQTHDFLADLNPMFPIKQSGYPNLQGEQFFRGLSNYKTVFFKLTLTLLIHHRIRNTDSAGNTSSPVGRLHFPFAKDGDF